MNLNRYILVGVGMFLFGVLLSTMLFSRYVLQRGGGVIVQTDTVVVNDTLRFDAEEIKTERVESQRVEYVYVTLPPEVVEKVVRDTTFVEAPVVREHFYSEVDDVRIWHSGIASSIDSLENVRQTKLVTNRVVKDFKHSVGIYANAGYANGFSVPIGVRYTYHPKRWLGVGVRAEHDMIKDHINVMGTLEISLGW